MVGRVNRRSFDEGTRGFADEPLVITVIDFDNQFVTRLYLLAMGLQSE
jgi:hypothetical protein